MRKLTAACGILAGGLAVLAQSPATRVIAYDKAVAQTQQAAEASSADPAKRADIVTLMELTGAKSLGQQILQASLEQLRTSIKNNVPPGPRGQQFLDEFIRRFQAHFRADDITQQVIPIYDKYLSGEDLKGLIEFYKTPVGQHMIQAQPKIFLEAQALGYSMGEKAARQAMNDLKDKYPDFMAGSQDGPPKP